MWRAGFSFRKHNMLNEEGKKDRSPPNRTGSCEKMVRYSLLLAVLEKSVSLRHSLEGRHLYPI